ncbi:MAG: hypothetical protein QM817_00640 [Archangium sp.]
MADAGTSLGRGAIGGVMLGAGVSGLVLGALSVMNATRACTYPGTLECTVELETYGHIARLQAYAAIGLILIAAGVFLFRFRGR